MNSSRQQTLREKLLNVELYMDYDSTKPVYINNQDLDRIMPIILRHMAGVLNVEKIQDKN